MANDVTEDILVYRLVPIRWCEVIDGEWAFQSGAFDNASATTEDGEQDRMSVVLENRLQEFNRVPERLPVETTWFDDPENWGVAALESKYLREEEEQAILSTPTKNEPAHGDVQGQKNRNRRRRMKKHAWWVVQPASPPPPE